MSWQSIHYLRTPGGDLWVFEAFGRWVLIECHWTGGRITTRRANRPYARKLWRRLVWRGSWEVWEGPGEAEEPDPAQSSIWAFSARLLAEGGLLVGRLPELPDW